MKKIYLILLVVTLFSGFGTVAFFMTKKKKDSKKNSPKVPVITPEEKAAIALPKPVIAPPKPAIIPSVPQKPLVNKSLEMDIKVPYVEVENRRFDYSMHYKGIPYKGTFEDGVTSAVHVKKTFGSFVVSQRKNLEEEPFALPDRSHLPVGRNTAKDQKIKGDRSISSKGGAVKVGKTGRVLPIAVGQGISGLRSLNSDWVDLFIADAQNRILKQLSVNLRTGERTDAKIKF